MDFAEFCQELTGRIYHKDRVYITKMETNIIYISFLGHNYESKKNKRNQTFGYD